MRRYFVLKSAIAFMSLFLLLSSCKKTSPPAIKGTWKLSDVSILSGYTGSNRGLVYNCYYQNKMLIGSDSDYANGHWTVRFTDTFNIVQEDWQINEDGSFNVTERYKFNDDSLDSYNAFSALWQLSDNGVFRLNQNRCTLLGYVQGVAEQTMNVDMSTLKVKSITDHQLILTKDDVDSVSTGYYQYQHVNCKITFTR